MGPVLKKSKIWDRSHVMRDRSHLDGTVTPRTHSHSVRLTRHSSDYWLWLWKWDATLVDKVYQHRIMEIAERSRVEGRQSWEEGSRWRIGNWRWRKIDRSLQMG